MEHLGVILSALFAAVATVITAWFTYNQKNKEKKTDAKIEKMKQDSDQLLARNNRQIAFIYGELGSLLNRLDVDRCFIIQPHPEHKHMFLSVFLEVDKKGRSMVKDIFSHIPMSEMGSFAKELATKPFIYLDDVDAQVTDKRTRSLMLMAGSTHIAIKQLCDANGSWIGSLVVENIEKHPLDIEAAITDIKNAANTIQFILPPVN